MSYFFSLTREHLIQLTLTSVWLEGIFYKINFEISHTIDCNRHCTVNVILQLPAVK